MDFTLDANAFEPSTARRFNSMDLTDLGSFGIANFEEEVLEVVIRSKTFK